MIIKPDWNIFKAKFSENPQWNFEWFCYLLFTQEFDKPIGIFRYKNQSGIETNPINKDNEVIGWQAKFYETTLSANKDELISMLEKSNRDYPEVTKIILYTNQEWGQGKDQNDPKAKIEVETKATELNIDIDWRTASYFESIVVTIENKELASHFFRLEKSIIDLLEEKSSHSKSLLHEIQTDIDFNNHKIEIDRENQLNLIKEEIAQNRTLIISGVGGVGKTSIIKKYYYETNDEIPIYIFKASEFNVININDLFGDFNLQDFVEAHKQEETKIIVIDSAEKLLDFKNSESFKIFLSTLIRYDWKTIFTTRNSYLSDLNYEFIETHKIVHYEIEIQNLNPQSLVALSEKYNFVLPADQKILDLIVNPFYLKEYLENYNEIEEKIDYIRFKEKLWYKNIRKSKPNREQSFLKIVSQRVEEGNFSVIPDFTDDALEELRHDGILGYETAGYFISHDIYEEWALEKIINNAYIREEGASAFFENIGESLAIRRSFRNWLSDKLLIKDESVEQFVEEAIELEEIDSSWKDEILISVLLSDYSETFFQVFEENLLKDKQKLLCRLSFLIRLACKEVDYTLLKQNNIKNLDISTIGYIPTKPKGHGWNSIVKFIHEHLEHLELENIQLFLPIIHDWNSINKKGETTKYSGLIALEYYQLMIQRETFYSQDDDFREKLIQTILYGAAEIKEELIIVFDEIIENKWKHHRDPYYDFSIMILTDFGTNIGIIKTCPEYVFELANLFWFKEQKTHDKYSYAATKLEDDFHIDTNHYEYNPPSAYQSPIYLLLKNDFKSTIDFIINFTNQSVECYAKSESAQKEIEEINLTISDSISVKQYIDNRLWNAYRGTQVSAHLFESIHMGLEKALLELAEKIDSKTLQSCLVYLLRKSKSASITAVVSSVALANPEKTFSVAKILFQTKELFFYDTFRFSLEQGHKNSLIMWRNGLPTHYKNKIHEDERIESCDCKHRNKSLEQLALEYQFFKSEETSDDEVDNRQATIWSIFDNYYKKLPVKSNETENDKIWRLYLARMDRRKMEPIVEVKDRQLSINFNPEIDSDLKEYSENSDNEFLEAMKYGNLKLWSSHKLNNDERYSKYPQYEDNPNQALKEVKEIIDVLKNNGDEQFALFNYSIPAYVCSVLMRDCSSKLSKPEKELCTNIILGFAFNSRDEDYRYQVSDGTDAAISVLSCLFNKNAEQNEQIKLILLFTLFKQHTIIGQNYKVFAVREIDNLYRISFDNAQSILLGYLLLSCKYKMSRESLIQKIRNDKHSTLNENTVIMKFFEENEDDIQRVLENKIYLEEIVPIENVDLESLNTAFQLIPLNPEKAEYKKLTIDIISVISKRLLSQTKTKSPDISIKHEFSNKLAYVVLSSPKEELIDYLEVILDNFNSSEFISDLFQDIIRVENTLHTHDNFWTVWNLFYEKITEMSKTECDQYHKRDIIKSYLLANTPWNENNQDLHALKDTDKKFFRNITRDMGHCTLVLYSISKLLNGVGRKYLKNGIVWISQMLDSNTHLWNDKLEKNTIYYMENMMKIYIHENFNEIRKTKKQKKDVLTILHFLIEKGSVTGYMLRERIL